MANTNKTIEKIKALLPDAAVSEGDSAPVVTVAAAQWHDLALALRNDMGMDFLTTIVGMDWTESMGAIYYVMSTATNEVVGIKVIAEGTRELPYMPSAADVWNVATLYEREVYDFFG